jgi:hypothetical protein
MPKATRPQRTKQLLKAYAQHWRLCRELATKRRTLLKHLQQDDSSSTLDDGDSPSSTSDSAMGSDNPSVHSLDSPEESSMSSFSSRTDTSTDSDLSLGSQQENEVFVVPLESDDSDDATYDSSDESDGFCVHSYSQSQRMSLFVRNEIESMHLHRYEEARNRIPRGPSFLSHVLIVLKNSRPDHFRQALRVSPMTFDKMVERFADDPVFFNNLNQPQMPVEDQLAIALYRFGHNGNAASLQSVANWAGVGKGTVTLATRRVMTALLRADFMHEVIRMPNNAEKEAAKQWVEEHSCAAWRDGWCFVDGTLVPLASRPHWYGPSYFDRKSNYSLNVQVSAKYVSALSCC